jgi:transposase
MVTDQQVRKLFVLAREDETKAIVAMKSGMNRKTARKYEKARRLPSEMKKPHTWKTRWNPFEDIWEKIREMLKLNPGLEAKTIFKYLQRETPGEYQNGQLRTLQRKIKRWRVTEGPPKEVYFPQIHYPGDLSQSDFTNMNKLRITIQREIFEHLVYHFILTYSNWQTGTICFSESFESLSTGLQNALWKLEGIPKKHRTDSLSAAVHKECNPEVFTLRYRALLRHYGLNGSKTNAQSANELGDAEQCHNRFKKAVEQSLLLRGSRDFESREEYKSFLGKMFDQLNAGCRDRFQEELKILNTLPARRLEDYKPIIVRVGPGSTVSIQNNTYSVDSRLKDEKVQARLFAEHIEIWYGQRLIEKMPRLRGRSKHSINYRHIIDSLVRKPGAFENYRYKADMFPTSYFRMAYDYLKDHNPGRANKEYLKILHTAKMEGESITENAIRELLSQEQIISGKRVEELVNTEHRFPDITDVEIEEIDLARYDDLLCRREEIIVHE